MKPWKRQRWIVPPEENGVFVAGMERLLDVYRRPTIRWGRWCAWTSPPGN